MKEAPDRIFNADEQVAESLGRLGTAPTDEEMIEALLELGKLCDKIDSETESQANT